MWGEKSVDVCPRGMISNGTEHIKFDELSVRTWKMPTSASADVNMFWQQPNSLKHQTIPVANSNMSPLTKPLAVPDQGQHPWLRLTLPPPFASHDFNRGVFQLATWTATKNSQQNTWFLAIGGAFRILQNVKTTNAVMRQFGETMMKCSAAKRTPAETGMDVTNWQMRCFFLYHPTLQHLHFEMGSWARWHSIFLSAVDRWIVSFQVGKVVRLNLWAQNLYSFFRNYIINIKPYIISNILNHHNPIPPQY